MSNVLQENNWLTNKAIVHDPTGLHARPAVKLTKLAKSFSSRIELQSPERNDWINAKSPNAVMKLKVPHGHPLHMRASGDDAEAALGALVDLVNRDFND